MLASLAATRQPSAISTRQRQAQTYGSSLVSVRQSERLSASFATADDAGEGEESAAGRIELAGGVVFGGRIGDDFEVEQYARDFKRGCARRGIGHRAPDAAQRPAARD